MKIAIIGGGSLGLLFAHYLNEFHHVCLYVRSMEQEFTLSSEGLIFEKNEQKIVHSINTAKFSAWEGNEDLTILAVKQYHLPDILQRIADIAPCYKGSFLFLQNGMGHIKLLDSIQANNVYIGSVEHGAKKESLNHVIHTGNGITRIAIYKGQSLNLMNEIANQYVDRFPFVTEKDYESMLVKKLIVNSVINPLTAVLNVRNGELLDNPYYNKLFEQMFNEISSILYMENKDETLSHLENVCRKTAANRSSMLQDLDGNRPTEVDAILGYVLEKAGDIGVHAPLTEFFYHSIKGKEY
ncbi:2-dehydropantoate 2-reductase [Bacillus sp. JJ1532]|uniref:2-dehydropantoate 2-reductase n=1 Tax=Bacillus sp. JJ1532 TaxID=3122958 RepID=UPI002FFEA983